MKRSRLIMLVSVGVVWIIIVAVVMWRYEGKKRQDEETKRLLMSTAWSSTDGHSATLRFTKEKYILKYFPGAGRPPGKAVEYPYTVRGDIIELQGEKVIKVRIKHLTRDDLFLIEEGGNQLHYERQRE